MTKQVFLYELDKPIELPERFQGGLRKNFEGVESILAHPSGEVLEGIKGQIGLTPEFRLYEYRELGVLLEYVAHEEPFTVGTPVMLATIDRPFKIRLDNASRVAEVKALDFERYLQIISEPGKAYLESVVRGVPPPPGPTSPLYQRINEEAKTFNQ